MKQEYQTHRLIVNLHQILAAKQQQYSLIPKIRAGYVANYPENQHLFLVGAGFAALLLPLGYKVFWWGVNRSKREGTLGWY